MDKQRARWGRAQEGNNAIEGLNVTESEYDRDNSGREMDMSGACMLAETEQDGKDSDRKQRQDNPDLASTTSLAFSKQ